MKVKQNEDEFKPVTIVLETEDEFSILKWALSVSYLVHASSHMRNLAEAANKMYVQIDSSTK